MEGKVAIVGIGCRYPGGVNTPGDFWSMLAEGRDCTIPPPDDRFDASFFWHPNRTPGKLYNRCGGYLQCNVFEFDRQFFKIPPGKASGGRAWHDICGYAGSCEKVRSKANCGWLVFDEIGYCSAAPANCFKLSSKAFVCGQKVALVMCASVYPCSSSACGTTAPLIMSLHSAGSTSELRVGIS
ncbi:hypothetical protein Bbelb_424440 [Branchiostoma belcheri]|nr:hypothetical protein Bbelb_424440 [Branchiostoma belcheri]